MLDNGPPATTLHCGVGQALLVEVWISEADSRPSPVADFRVATAILARLEQLVPATSPGLQSLELDDEDLEAVFDYLVA